MKLFDKKYILTILGYDINKSLKELASLKLLSRDGFWKLQSKKRDSIVQYHLKHNPWYKKFVGNSSTIDWYKIPIITKMDLQDYAFDIIPKKQIFRNYYFANTSGSSGHPLFFKKDKKCHSFAWAKIIEVYGDLGITKVDKEARFFGHVKDSKKTRLFEEVKDLLLNRIRFDIFDISDTSLLRYYYKFKSNKFGYIYGYTNVILEFSKFILKKSLPSLKDICPSLKLCIVTAEMCFEEDKKIIQRALGVPVYREYGASETSIIALEDKTFKWAINTDRLWIEVLDENNKPVKNGKSGRIIITDLYNHIFPFIRYDIGDIGTIEKENRYPFLFLKDLQGRESDLIHLPSGKKAPGLTFYYIARSILEKTSNIREFRIVQKTIDTFRFLIVSEKGLSNIDKDKILEATNKYLEPKLKIEFEMCRQIRKKYSGKIQHFFSEINHHNDSLYIK